MRKKDENNRWPIYTDENGNKFFCAGKMLLGTDFSIVSENSEAMIRKIFRCAYICAIFVPAILKLTVRTLNAIEWIVLSVVLDYVVFYIAARFASKSLKACVISESVKRNMTGGVSRLRPIKIAIMILAFCYAIYYELTIGADDRNAFYLSLLFLPMLGYRILRWGFKNSA